MGTSYPKCIFSVEQSLIQLLKLNTNTHHFVYTQIHIHIPHIIIFQKQMFSWNCYGAFKLLSLHISMSVFWKLQTLESRQNKQEQTTIL